MYTCNAAFSEAVLKAVLYSELFIRGYSLKQYYILKGIIS
jgi:hypothetical protein